MRTAIVMLTVVLACSSLAAGELPPDPESPLADAGHDPLTDLRWTVQGGGGVLTLVGEDDSAELLGPLATVGLRKQFGRHWGFQARMTLAVSQSVSYGLHATLVEELTDVSFRFHAGPWYMGVGSFVGAMTAEGETVVGFGGVGETGWLIGARRRFEICLRAYAGPFFADGASLTAVHVAAGFGVAF